MELRGTLGFHDLKLSQKIFQVLRQQETWTRYEDQLEYSTVLNKIEIKQD